ncbi:hypothetical protein GCM10010885_10000 [Alicyclobacillus cellulosilyticus]|uniref:Thiosulfate dehydrogenase [quinone] large subunit n=1 Tax=Alicyclobacillus cellulosilyticus TaxID=1003997 RepID=A0A917K6M1_9BACL|nr:DoxX family membrane protein [Alicyclobacillus cellulosilyticus]GGJ02685.1 hypothetical protein GCM10010885_10000 [Alicyclobacillus cellulosilyticus]
MVQWLRNSVVARWLLTVLRIWIGVEWIQAATEKIGSPVWTGAKAGVAVSGFLQHALTLTGGAHPAVQGWYGGFIRNVALPNAKLFSYLVSYGELLVGIGLILGCFTTFAALAGVVMNMSYLLAGTTSTNPNMVIWQVLLLVAGANAGYYGLDYFVLPYVRRLYRKWLHMAQAEAELPARKPKMPA